MVLKRRKGFAFVRADQGDLQAVTVVPYDAWIMGGGFGWRVGPGDKIIGEGRLNGGGDCLVVTSSWGMGVWVPGSNGMPTLLSIHQNGTTFRNPNGRTWKLDTTDPRFRFLEASDIDNASDKRAEMVLVSSSGLAILHEKGMGVWGESLDLRFALKDGERFSGTPVNSTLHWLVKVRDFNKRGARIFSFRLKPASPSSKRSWTRGTSVSSLITFMDVGSEAGTSTEPIYWLRLPVILRKTAEGRETS